MKKPKRILLGMKDPHQAVELADLACRMGAHRASLLMVHVIELPPATPLDAELPEVEAAGKKALRTAERLARQAGLTVTTRILHARSAADALLHELKENKIDLAVLGYHHPHGLGEILLGTTARFLIRHAPCHVLISIPPR